MTAGKEESIVLGITAPSLILSNRMTEICICKVCNDLEDDYTTCDVNSRRVKCDKHQPRIAS